MTEIAVQCFKYISMYFFIDAVMEVPIIQTWAHMHPPNVILKPTINTSSLAPELTTKRRGRIMAGHQDMDVKIVNYSVSYMYYVLDG